MTQEEKRLLLVDLCARLPYGVIVKYKSQEGEGDVQLGCGNIGYVLQLGNGWWKECKPYLRPMPSMTEEEYKEYDKATDLDVADSGETLKANLKAKSRVRVSKWYHGNDWLNSHHFDYRGLIKKGLAIEAPEGMYK